jgi:hypothetical protein
MEAEAFSAADERLTTKTGTRFGLLSLSPSTAPAACARIVGSLTSLTCRRDGSISPRSVASGCSVQVPAHIGVPVSLCAGVAALETGRAAFLSASRRSRVPDVDDDDAQVVVLISECRRQKGDWRSDRAGSDPCPPLFALRDLSSSRRPSLMSLHGRLMRCR